MSYYRGPAYPPRKRPRGDYYDGGDRYNRGPPQPRQSLEDSILTRLRKDFISLADPKSNSQATAADDIDYIAKSIVAEFKSDIVKSGICQLLYHCVLELPPKIPYFASLVVVANARKAAVGKDILEFTVGKVKEVLEAGDLVTGKLLLRFLAGLARIVEDDGVLTVIGEIVSKIEGQEPNARTDNLARLVLLTLPYTAVSPKAPTAGLDAIIDRLTPYMDSRDTNETSFITPFKSLNPDPLGDYSALHLLWLQTKTLKQNEWDIPFLPRPWFAFRTELESNTTSHPLPTFTLDFSTTTIIPPLQPEYFFSIFLNNEKHTVPSLDSIAATLLRDVIVDTTHQLVFNRKQAAQLLIDLPASFPTGLFHRPGLSLRDLPDHQPTRPKYKLEDLVVDALFSQLMRLPAPRDREVYYASLVTEVTKLAPGDVAPTLGRGIRWMYDHLNDLRGELCFRFSTWFALHLSNFGFTYKWDEWVGDLEMEDGMPKKVFLRETLEKEVRLSYLERIQRTLPEEYFAVFPTKPDVDNWKPISDRFGGAEDSEKLVEAIRARDEDAISQYLTSTSNPSDILIPAILFASHETPYSHTLSPPTVELVKKYCSVEETVITSIMSFWRDRPATAMVLVMKFVDLEALTVGGVVQWVLGQDEWMRKGWGWELVQIVVEKVDGLSVRKVENKTTTGEAVVESGEDGNGEKVVEEKAKEEEMQVDSTNGVMNGTMRVNEERKELFSTIVAGVGACYERQTVLDKEWLKEWFGMVVRKYSADVVRREGGEDWVAEMLTQSEEYTKRFI